MRARFVKWVRSAFLVLIAGLFAVVALIVGYKAIEASPPSQAELPAIIARDEGVQPSEVQVFAYTMAHGEPGVLFRLTVPSFSASDGSPMPQLIKFSWLVRPFDQPWEWAEGDGGYGWQPNDDGAAVSLDLTRAIGDTDTSINTLLFGVALPEVAEIQLTIRGQRYIRDLRQSHGFILLLPDKGVIPSEIKDIRVLDDSGRELPTPSGFGAGAFVPAPYS